jgi:hypothetical protein
MHIRSKTKCYFGKQENGCNTIRLEDDSWSHPIYVAADDKSDIKSIPKEEGEIFLANQRL